MTYYANVNPELLAWMPLTAKRVLELGCGAGSLAAAYRERNPHVHYTAVEMFEPVAKEALDRVDRLLIGDFQTMSDVEVSGDQPFDLIVLGDVLEHLVEAEQVLCRLRTMLTDDGVLALSVPNIGHWTAFYHLLNGRWPQDNDGLFDRTHVRFFTLEALQQALATAGFTPLKIRPRNVLLDQAAAEKWIPRLADCAESMGIDRGSFAQRASALQYVAVARKADATAVPIMRLSVAAMAPRALETRALLPAEFLQSSPDIVVHYQERSISLPHADLATPKVLVVQRPAKPDPAEWLNFMTEIMKRCWIAVIEFDDHPDLVARVLQIELDTERFGWVHAIQTSTPPLAEAFRAYNAEVGVFPNAAFRRPAFVAARDQPPTVFYGALNRGDYAVQLAKKLAPAIEAVPDLKFEVAQDRAFFDALPTDRKQFQPFLSYDDYTATLRRCDIALLPLEGRHDELFKSDLKYVECGAVSVATIASPAVYSGTIRSGKTGIIAATLEDWAPSLITLATDPALRAQIAKAAWDDVGANRMFANQIPDRLSWYRDLWARRDELNAALFARMPGLAERVTA